MAGPAFHQLPQLPIHPSFPPLRPGLSLWQVPPHPHPPTSSSPSLPLLDLPGFHILMHRTWLATVVSLIFQPAFPPLHPPLILIPTPPHPHHSGPACHCGRSRQGPSSLSLHLPPSASPSLTPLLFVTFFGPAYHCGRSHLPHLHYLPFTSPFLSLLLLPIRGPACHCGRSRLVFPLLLPVPASPLPFSPLLPYSFSPLAAPRAPVAMGDPK